MFEPVSSLVGTQVLDKALQVFGDGVVARWSRYRAEQFLRGLLLQLEKGLGGTGHQSASDLLRELVEDPEKSSALFDAYRQVTLSKSRELGPRVVAIVMGQAVLGRGSDSLDRALVIEAATALSDKELYEAREEIRQRLRERDDDLLAATEEPGTRVRSLRVESNSVSLPLEGSAYSEHGTLVGPEVMSYCFGFWAVRLSSLGLITTTIEERVNGRLPRESDYLEEDPPSRTLTWHVAFEPECVALAEFVEWLAPDQSPTT